MVWALARLKIIMQISHSVIFFVILLLVECRNSLTGNEQGLALLGYLKTVSRQLKPNIVLKV